MASPLGDSSEKDFSIGAVIVDLCEMLRPEAEHAGKQLHSLAADDIIVDNRVGGGHAALQRALTAMVLEALRATPESSTVAMALSANPIDGTISIVISDQRRDFQLDDWKRFLQMPATAMACAEYRQSGGQITGTKLKPTGAIVTLTMHGV